MDKFVITNEDIATVPEEPALTPLPVPPKLPPAVPLWVKVALSPFVLALPVLCLLAIVFRIALRAQPPRTRHGWDAFLGTLLIISGILFTGGMAFVVSTGIGTVPISSGLASFDEKEDFPHLPAVEVMSGREISSKLKPLVVIASPAQKLWFRKQSSPSGMIGAAFLLHANAAGYLFATARHIVEGFDRPSMQGSAGEVMLSTAEGGWSDGKVIARHRSADLALVWVPRHEGTGDFCQPITPASQVKSGDSVFVIGHPEGLNFSLSTGIVSRVAEHHTLQISAPISPGNSGGPVYDPRGSLLGIVSYTFNKNLAPNAENLNFAVDADLLFGVDGWQFEDDGAEKLASYRNACGGPQTIAQDSPKNKGKEASPKN